MKYFRLTFATLVLVASIGISSADTAVTPTDRTSRAVADATRSEGEIRKVDPETKKITIKHGELKNLDMPAMTMVFQVKDWAMVGQVKAGDKVRFRADKVNGAFTIMEIEVIE